jgi:hypothetical protein
VSPGPELYLLRTNPSAPSADHRFWVFNPSHIQCSGKGLLILENDLSDIISLYRTKSHLFHTCYLVLKYQSFQDFHDTVLMVLHFRVTWLLSLIPTVAYGLWESFSKFKFQVKITCSLPGNNSV